MKFFTDALIVPFDVSFISRALVAGCLAAILCSLIGTWVILRRLTFFGDAMSHGLLPGVATASLLGGNLMFGAAISALIMSAGVVWTSRKSSLSQDVSIGLQFITMLSLGVVIVSHSDSHAVDLTSFLFGDILGVRPSDIFIIAIATVLGGLTIFLFHRQFTALAFDERKAHTLGLNPRFAHLLMLALIALATVVSFQVVGTLLVFGLLIGPPATAALLVQDKASISLIMIVASLLGCAEIYLGLLISWHASTAAGATITLLSAAIFFATLLTKSAISRLNFTA
ncbi:ABC-type putative manganese/zinc transporter, permease subunit [Corynebacterium glutamicum MB001]|uniref:ABC-type transporter, permease components n=1 Tax=Corynebacterium glutamicum (strain ATCC 13032 / DSM 20300 / JCM 1318 / BCRC 11384 / CCUG 27702 / LMG 3730 / NBRC 12168 / NCIMB 10025 / NRRL B-2784 / 534) TaxID=196627 RepID=Q8NUB1_CORGL|nr:zinc ABC transporter permease AztB [Corynebacterium glutamicum]AGT04039.1 ABC-type putative manganese/zinc transporter, permease subunit [Corynebacterium glutamicum MB001]ARV65705.1 ABC transporter permease [Corynebacterium glutamicum]ASW12818.1 ABC-type putative manganese/zinc transporter, permease subunit [Corynebacterium glutamicum]AUH99663.1 metal ABC transporter permease [Corynebacterium glutamicum]AUI03303.1 metal ABC transporter permease [Corynebacterium glutamicum]